MHLRSYISLKARKGRKSAIHNRGLFAVAPIRKGEVVAIKGGHIIDHATLKRKAAIINAAFTQIEDEFFIAPLRRDEVHASMIYFNHSCEPNCGVRGQISFVAMRGIRPGEELTIDYAMTDNDPAERMTCNCGCSSCRGEIRGTDWKLPTLQKKYRGYFSSYLAEKISLRRR